MPSSNERALEKAKSIPCDGLILDLEDAVAPDAKPAAREAACAAAASGEYGTREVTIRVNGADTEWHADDLAAACAAGPDAIVVPKVDTADAVLQLVEAMAGHDAPEHTKLWAMVETPYAMLHARGDRRGLRAADRAGDGHQRPGQGAVRRARARPPAAAHRARPGPARRPGDRQGDPRRRLQRREGHRRLPRRVPAGPRDGLRRQDPDPPRPGRRRQRGVRPVRAGRRGRPRHPPGLGGRPGLRRRHLQRPDDREPPRRVRPAHPDASTRRSAP